MVICKETKLLSAAGKLLPVGWKQTTIGTTNINYSELINIQDLTESFDAINQTHPPPPPTPRGTQKTQVRKVEIVCNILSNQVKLLPVKEGALTCPGCTLSLPTIKLS